MDNAGLLSELAVLSSPIGMLCYAGHAHLNCDFSGCSCECHRTAAIYAQAQAAALSKYFS